MRSLLTRYSIYFNKRHNRVGTLFQDTYKAALITDEPYLLHLSRYIHLNPTEFTPDILRAYSSYGDYLHLRKTQWVKPELILSFFDQKILPLLKKINSYQSFVEKYKVDSSALLGNLTLEDSGSL